MNSEAAAFYSCGRVCCTGSGAGTTEKEKHHFEGLLHGFDRLQSKSGWSYAKPLPGILKDNTEQSCSPVTVNSDRIVKRKVGWKPEPGQTFGTDPHCYITIDKPGYSTTVTATTDDEAISMPPLKKRAITSVGISVGVEDSAGSRYKTALQKKQECGIFLPSQGNVESTSVIAGRYLDSTSIRLGDGVPEERDLELISAPLVDTPNPELYYNQLTNLSTKAPEKNSILSGSTLRRSHSYPSNRLMQDDVNSLLVRVPFQTKASLAPSKREHAAFLSSQNDMTPTRYLGSFDVGTSSAIVSQNNHTVSDKYLLPSGIANSERPYSISSHFKSPGKASNQPTNTSAADDGASFPNFYSNIKCKPTGVFLNFADSDDTSGMSPTIRVARSRTENMKSVLEQDKGCICKRSRCLKLYCKCFQTGNFCNANICKCSECRNLIEFDRPQGIRRNAISETLARRPDAFASRPLKRTGEGCACKKNR